MTALLTALVTWLAANFDLPAIYDLPEVRFVPTAQISDLRYRDIATRRRRAVIAVYDDASRTIFLSDAWTGQSAEELSILVHEMVHHLQNLAGHRHPCPERGKSWPTRRKSAGSAFSALVSPPRSSSTR